MHGDWVVGYYMNYYNIGTQHSYFKHDKVRIEQKLGYMYEHPEGNCHNIGQTQCDDNAHVCHQIQATSMSFLSRKLAKATPGTFYDTK